MKTKKLLNFLLAIVMVVSMMATLGITASAVPRTDATPVYVGETYDCVAFVSSVTTFSDEEQDGNIWYFYTTDETKLKVVNCYIEEDAVEGDKLHVFLKGIAVGNGLEILCKQYDAESTSWVEGVSAINGIYNVVPAPVYLDLDSTTTDIKDSKDLEQKYTLTLTAGTYTDLTKVKLEWTIGDITASRADAKIWNPNTLTWVDDNNNDVINAGEATATFTLTNLSSVKVKAKVEFEAVTGFAPTVVYTGVNATTHKTRIGTVVNDDKSVTSTNSHAATVTVKVTPKKADFASLDATTSATKYGTYTVTLSENISDYQSYANGIATATAPETFVVDEANKTITIKDEEAFLYYGLVYRANTSNADDITAKLDADLDLDELVIANGFNCKSNFDGQNHTIANLTVIGAVNGRAGFFKTIDQTGSEDFVSVKNLVLDNVHINGAVSTGDSCSGILVGYVAGTEIKNVTVKNSSVTGGKYTGGIAGISYTDIIGCTVKDSVVSGQYKCGGLIGFTGEGNGRDVQNNTLTNVTINCANLLEGRNHYETGKVIGDWNSETGTYIGNTVSGVTIVNGSTGYTDNEIGAIESGCTVNYGEN